MLYKLIFIFSNVSIIQLQNLCQSLIFNNEIQIRKSEKSISIIYKITQSPDFRCCCRLLLAEDPTDHCDRDLRIGVLSGSSGSSVLGLGRDSLCRRFWRDCLSLSRDLDLPRLRAVEPVEPLLNIRPRGLRSGVSESAGPRTGESPYRLGWERFGWESCRARSDLVLARPDRPRDLERLRNMLDCPPPPPAPPAPPAPPPPPPPAPPPPPSPADAN